MVNEDGTAEMALRPQPARRLWKEGMKLGYQDAGSWTLMKSTPEDRAKAAWLLCAFVTSKTVDVKKSHTGLTFIRQSTLDHESFTERAPKLAAWSSSNRLRRPACTWSPTGTNVPDYPKLAQLWWQAIGDASSGAKTAQEAMDSLCEEQEKVMERGLEPRRRAGRHRSEDGPKSTISNTGTRMPSPRGNLAPQLKIENEKEQPLTVNYDELVKSWQE